MSNKLGRAPRVKVEVTRELIEQATKRSSSHCMFAEAVKVAVPNANFVSVDLQTIRWTDPVKGERYTYLTPRSAQVALVQFDQGITPEPFPFQLRGGQTTRSGKTKRAAPKADTKGKRQQSAHLRRPQGGSGTGSSVSEKAGGSPPPLAALSNSARVRGSRRAFGLRALQY